MDAGQVFEGLFKGQPVYIVDHIMQIEFEKSDLLENGLEKGLSDFNVGGVDDGIAAVFNDVENEVWVICWDGCHW